MKNTNLCSYFALGFLSFLNYILFTPTPTWTFFFLLSTFMCYQPTKLILGFFCFFNFQFFTPSPQSFIRAENRRCNTLTCCVCTTNFHIRLCWRGGVLKAYWPVRELTVKLWSNAWGVERKRLNHGADGFGQIRPCFISISINMCTFSYLKRIMLPK